MPKMDITLVMVLKNEAKTIGKTIASVSSVIKNVVCGIDSTTSDKTEKIIKSYCVEHSIPYEIEHFDFKNDFAAVRNYFIAKSPTDWVLILDGHEYIRPTCIHYFNDLIENEISSQFEIFDFNIVDKDLNEGNEVVFQQPRLFKKQIRYFQAVHNVIYQNHKRTAVPQIIVVHDQPIDRLNARQEQRKTMNIEGLEKDAKAGVPRAMYYLGNTYYEISDFKNAKKWYQMYLMVSDFDAERYVARINLANIFNAEKNYIEAQKVLLSCFEDEVQLNEHLLMLGDLMMAQKKYYRAKDFYLMATTTPVPQRFLLINMDAYTWLPWYRLAAVGLATNDYELIRECINKGKQLAPERPEFFDLEAKIKEKTDKLNQHKLGTVYVVASLPSFIKPFMHYLLVDHYVIYDSVFNPANADKCDVIWCEWGDHNAIAVSHYFGKAKKILRIHAYEVFSNFMNTINFDKFDEIIFVANHIKDYFHGVIKFKKPTRVIYNGVDLTKFNIGTQKDPKKIAYAGYITNKKGAALLMSAAYELQDYEFHVAGEFQESDVRDFFLKTKPTNMFLYPWQHDLNQFFTDKTYIINTSPREGCPVAILEGMAAGLKPLIFKWVGADDIFGLDYWWVSMRSLKETISNLEKHSPTEMQKTVVDVFDQKYQFAEMDKIINSLIKELNHGEKQSKVA